MIFPFSSSIKIKTFTVALILFGVGLLNDEGYADTSFTTYKIKEIKNLSKKEARRVKKSLNNKIKVLVNNSRDLEKKNRDLEAQIKGIEKSLAFICIVTPIKEEMIMILFFYYIIYRKSKSRVFIWISIPFSWCWYYNLW